MKAEFNNWQKSDEAKSFWRNRENDLQEHSLQTDSTTSTSAMNTSTSATTSSVTVSTSSKKLNGLNALEVKNLSEQNLISTFGGNKFEVDGVDILTAVHALQKSLGRDYLTYKSHIYELLSTAGILLLRKEASPVIDCQTANALRRSILEENGMSGEKFSKVVLIKLMVIIQDFLSNKINLIKAVQQLLALVDEDGTNYDDKVLVCFKSLIEHLPLEPFEGMEIELSTRLLQPLLQPLLEDRQNHVYFRWTDAQTEEFKRDPSCYNKRPDGCITHEDGEKRNLGFVEVKEEKHKNDRSKINKDIYKLGMFTKDAIEQNKLNGGLSVFAVGPSITLYSTRGFYTMTEIQHFDAPPVISCHSHFTFIPLPLTI